MGLRNYQRRRGDLGEAIFWALQGCCTNELTAAEAPAFDEACQQSSTEQETGYLAEDLLTAERESVFFKHVAPSRSATIQWAVA